MSRRLFSTSLLFPLLYLSVAAEALAGGGGPFLVRATARAERSAMVDSSFVTTATEPPAIALIAQGAGSSFASATFTELGASEDNTILGESFNALAVASDQLTIAASGAPAGTTHLELTWRLTGQMTFRSGTAARARFKSDYATNGVDQPLIPGGDLILTDADAGVIEQDVTFVYDHVPVGTPWNLLTFLEVRSNGSESTLDFANTASLTRAAFFVDDVQINALVTGQSGAVYAIPEPASLVLLGLALISIPTGSQRTGINRLD